MNKGAVLKWQTALSIVVFGSWFIRSGWGLIIGFIGVLGMWILAYEQRRKS